MKIKKRKKFPKVVKSFEPPYYPYAHPLALDDKYFRFYIDKDNYIDFIVEDKISTAYTKVMARHVGKPGINNFSITPHARNVFIINIPKSNRD